MSPRKIQQARPQGVREAKPLLDPEVERIVSELDARWRARSQNQIGSINRLLLDSSYDKEMETLHEKLAACQAGMEVAGTLLRESGLAVASPAVAAALKILHK